jgi:predicted MFS family arabinose efflux permease
MVGQFGFWIAFIAFQVLMSRLTDANGRWLGLLFFVNFFPMLIFTPIAGVVADRIERRRILMRTFSLMALVMSALALLVLSGGASPLRLLPFAFAVGTIFAFNAPASQAIVAHSVPPLDLPSAISLQSSGAQLARVVGPTVAAPLLALWNEGAAFAAYAVSSVIVVFLLRRLELTPYEPEHDETGFIGRVRRGFDHARERPPSLAALSVLAMSSLFAAAYLALLPVLANDVYDRGPTGFATLAAVTGLGSMIGALTTAFRTSLPTLRSTALLVAAFGGAVAAFALVPSWNLALVAVVLVGGFYFSAMTTLNTLVQSLADENMRGRISSLFVIGWAGLVPIGGLWQGAAGQAIGPRTTLAIAGCITAVYALFAAVMWGRRHERTSFVVIGEGAT